MYCEKRIFNRNKIFFIFLGSFISTCFLVNLFWFYSGSEFNIRNFQISFVPRSSREPQWVDENARMQAVPALNQSFYYLGHGKQSMAFESADHEYVLKFFYKKRPLRKKWYLRLENWLRFCSSSWIYKSFINQRNNRLLLDRYRMAFEELREETGLIYVHLHPYLELNHTLKVYDRKGKLHFIDLNSLPFVVQKKAELALVRLRRLKNDPLATKQAVMSLKNLFITRAEKGFTDQRQVFKKNYGFIGDRAVQIDVGKIRKEKKIEEKEVEHILKKFDRWLQKRKVSLESNL